MNGGRLTGDFAAFEVVAESHGESRSTDGDLQRRDVVGRHVIFATSFVFVVDDVLAHVIVGTGVADRRLATSAVHHVDQHHDWAAKFEKCYNFFNFSGRKFFRVEGMP